jgi:hypothetical protein
VFAAEVAAPTPQPLAATVCLPAFQPLLGMLLSATGVVESPAIALGDAGLATQGLKQLGFPREFSPEGAQTISSRKWPQNLEPKWLRSLLKINNNAVVMMRIYF